MTEEEIEKIEANIRRDNEEISELTDEQLALIAGG